MSWKPLSLLTANWQWLLVLSVLPLFADNAVYNAPLILMAVFSAFVLLREPDRRQRLAELKWMLLGFAALWLPQLIALPDAADPVHSMKTALSYPAYLLAALFVPLVLGRTDLRKLHAGMLVIIAIWIADALLAWGGLEAWLGYTVGGARLTGLLFDKLTLGHIVAVLSPLVFDCLRRHWRKPLAWLLLIGLVLIVLLSGRRIAWLMLAVSCVGYFVYAGWALRALRLHAWAAALSLLLLAPSLLYVYYTPFQHRVDVTLGLFSADAATMDKATAHRLDIWKNAASIATDNWINGVGPRGFRHAYISYAGNDDYWTGEQGYPPTHPHQFVLEIAAETGLVGLIGYLLFWVCLYNALRETAAREAWVYALPVAIALFPLNAHLAFYGSYWTAFSWWLIGILFAALRSAGQSAAGRPSASA